jgi:hypothetical protein
MNSTTDRTRGAASFDWGDHVRYIGRRRCEVPAGPAGREVVLAPGMVGVVILSAGPSGPCHCRVQFKNGFQLDVTPDNRAEFEPAHTRGALAV